MSGFPDVVYAQPSKHQTQPVAPSATPSASASVPQDSLQDSLLVSPAPVPVGYEAAPVPVGYTVWVPEPVMLPVYSFDSGVSTSYSYQQNLQQPGWPSGSHVVPSAPAMAPAWDPGASGPKAAHIAKHQAAHGAASPQQEQPRRNWCDSANSMELAWAGSAGRQVSDSAQFFASEPPQSSSAWQPGKADAMYPSSSSQVLQQQQQQQQQLQHSMELQHEQLQQLRLQYQQEEQQQPQQYQQLHQTHLPQQPPQQQLQQQQYLSQRPQYQSQVQPQQPPQQHQQLQPQHLPQQQQVRQQVYNDSAASMHGMQAAAEASAVTRAQPWQLQPQEIAPDGPAAVDDPFSNASRLTTSYSGHSSARSTHSVDGRSTHSTDARSMDGYSMDGSVENGSMQDGSTGGGSASGSRRKASKRPSTDKGGSSGKGVGKVLTSLSYMFKYDQDKC